MAVENSEIFLGSGASLTFVPEVDFYFQPATTSQTSIQLHQTYAIQFQLVTNMYVGCTLDWYDNGVYTSSHTITANDNDTFTISPATANPVVIADDSFILRGYGAPCPAPTSSNDASGRIRLHADNWLGLVESASFPNVEVEMKQMNLQLGGSRNFTHQYKGIETASGGNINLVANHVTWLYYFLGKCYSISFASGVNSAQHPDNYHTGTAAHSLYIHGTSSTSHIDTGPFAHRVIDPNDSDDHLVPPINNILYSSPNVDFDSVTYPATDSTLVTYEFREANNSELPSFALEQSISKLGTNPLRTDADNDGREDLNFVRVARGNRVNSMTLTANENEEVKMTMDLNTRAVNTLDKAQTVGYDSRGGQTDERSLFNFTSDEGHLEPFFFSGGTIEAFGETLMKITNFTLTMNNNLVDKRFIGVSDKGIKSALPGQRSYEISLTALVTDDKLFTELLNSDENNETTESLKLVFKKNSDLESFTLEFDDYFLSSNSWTIPDDKGPVTVEATLMPRTLTSCTTTTHWILQG
tara:strand:+ start:193 stop:1773 length:1581 start_codon:yes stop_codon:yes gene_type:complete